MPKISAVTMGLLLSLLLAAPSGAQEVSEENKAAAKTAFDDGRAKFEAGQFKEAADAFRQAYDLMPSWKLLYNVGQAETAAGRYGLALDSFERYLAMGGDQVPTDRKEEVIAEITRMRAMVGFIEIKAPDGAVVFVDNVKRGVTPLPGRIKETAGIEHKVFVEIDKDNIFTRTVMVSGGETIVVEVSTARGETEVEESRTKDDPTTEDVRREVDEKAKPHPMVTVGWVLTGTGAAVLIGGGVTGLLSIVKTKQLKKDCDGTVCPSSRSGDIDSLKTTSLLSSILLPVGAAIAGTGAVLLILGSKRAAKKENNDISLVPLTSPDFNGLLLQGTF